MERYVLRIFDELPVENYELPGYCRSSSYALNSRKIGRSIHKQL